MMSNAPRKDNRKAAIAQIHIGKKQLCLDDETYRALLIGATKKDSCADMSLNELYAVIHVLEQKGWKKRRPSKGKYSPRAKGQYIDVMRAVWIEMAQDGMINDGSETSLTAYAKRMSSQLNGGIGVDTLEWLESDGKLAAKVLECLKKWQARCWREYRKEDFAAIHAYVEKEGVDVHEAALHLLETLQIFYWSEFVTLDIADNPAFIKNRKELHRVESQ